MNFERLIVTNFLRNFSDIFILSVKGDTGNFSEKYQQNFLLVGINLL